MSSMVPLHALEPPVIAVQAYGDEDYLILDCPGQIELYSHVSVFRTLADWLKAQVLTTRCLVKQVYRV